MRTTLNIDDDVLYAARELAKLEGRTLGDAVSRLARESLARRRAAVGGSQRNGVPLLARRSDGPVVTSEAVRSLEDAP